MSRLLPLIPLLAGCSIGAGQGSGGDTGRATAMPDLTTAAYLDGSLVFRRVELGEVRLGQTAGTRGLQADESASTTHVAPYDIAACELTPAPGEQPGRGPHQRLRHGYGARRSLADVLELCRPANRAALAVDARSSSVGFRMVVAS